MTPSRVQGALTTIVTAGVVAGISVAFGDVAVLITVSAAFLVTVIARVAATERQRPTPRWVGMTAFAGSAVLATRFVIWFGLLGGLLALLTMVIVVVTLGGDLG